MIVSVWPTVPSRVFISVDTLLPYWTGVGLHTSNIRWSGRRPSVGEDLKRHFIVSLGLPTLGETHCCDCGDLHMMMYEVFLTVVVV